MHWPEKQTISGMKEEKMREKRVERGGFGIFMRLFNLILPFIP